MTGDAAPAHPAPGLLLVAIFAAAMCGLLYELVAGTLASYLLGDPVTQFSLAIGVFLAAMGVGAWLSSSIRTALPAWLVGIELAVGVVGGSAAPLAFAAFAWTALSPALLLALVAAVGVLVGMEVPLVVRLARRGWTLPGSLAGVLAADYLGCLAAAVVFPFVLLPLCGTVRSGLLAGLANALVGLLLAWRLGPWLGAARLPLRLAAVAAVAALAAAFAAAPWLVARCESRLYREDVVHAVDTGRQRLVLTRWRDDVRLYLDGRLQFSSLDEYRYHEALVQPAMGLAASRERVLILGGGDGMAAREVLRYPGVASVDLVDMDPEVTRLFREHPLLARLNGGSLADPRVTVHASDALAFLDRAERAWDVVVMDLPDPSSAATAKLYTVEFFDLIGRRLRDGGTLACQCTSPYRARAAYWCIVASLRAASAGGERPFIVSPYTCEVPSFGTWGFVVAATRPLDLASAQLPPANRFLTAAMLPGLAVFPADTAELAVPINRLDSPVLVRLYQRAAHGFAD